MAKLWPAPARQRASCNRANSLKKSSKTSTSNYSIDFASENPEMNPPSVNLWLIFFRAA